MERREFLKWIGKGAVTACIVTSSLSTVACTKYALVAPKTVSQPRILAINSAADISIKFFGVYGGVFRPLREYKDMNLLSFSVETEEEGLLFEAGSNKVNEETLSKCKNLILSHAHVDHVLHLESLADKVNKIYCPRKNKIKGFTVLPEIPSKIGCFEITFLETKHTAPCYAYKIKNGDKTICYTGDTSYFEKLAEFCKGAEVLICESTLSQKYWKRAKIKGHMIPETTIKLAKKAEPGLLVLTHFNKLSPSDYLKEVKKGFDRVIASEEGLELKI